jgi:hypothetical protein
MEGETEGPKQWTLPGPPPCRLRRRGLWRTDGDRRQEQRECEESIALSGWQARGDHHGERVCACRAVALYDVLGYPDPRVPNPLSQDKLNTTYSHTRKICGYLIDS